MHCVLLFALLLWEEVLLLDLLVLLEDLFVLFEDLLLAFFCSMLFHLL